MVFSALRTEKEIGVEMGWKGRESDAEMETICRLRSLMGFCRGRCASYQVQKRLHAIAPGVICDDMDNDVWPVTSIQKPQSKSYGGLEQGEMVRLVNFSSMVVLPESIITNSIVPFTAKLRGQVFVWKRASSGCPKSTDNLRLSGSSVKDSEAIMRLNNLPTRQEISIGENKVTNISHFLEDRRTGQKFVYRLEEKGKRLPFQVARVERESGQEWTIGQEQEEVGGRSGVKEVREEEKEQEEEEGDEEEQEQDQEQEEGGTPL
ncbi:acidic leucine-rich nuclear phosphoprotein 32 family member A-like [Macrobrachium nipponense]|uniref:acidic leucine-rich nuclear phosphoprotein 32 family member A-like n=1 Tax=Macrobrachium nipponense TaxID=159736 RepID=UPI0030C80F55